MKSSIITFLLAAVTTVVAQPTAEPTINLSEDPAFVAAYNSVVNLVPNAIEKRACGALNPCCDSKTGCQSRDPCYLNCGSGPGTGTLGCIAGCATACPAKPKC